MRKVVSDPTNKTVRKASDTGRPSTFNQSEGVVLLFAFVIGVLLLVGAWFLSEHSSDEEIAAAFLNRATQTDEEIARALLNRATQTWDTGEFEAADQLFAQIEDNYLHTITATEAIEKRKQKQEYYRQQVDMKSVKRLNSGGFSSLVVQALALYFEENQTYPDELAQLETFDGEPFAVLQSLISGCEYQKALFNAGYSLDCLEADADYQQTINLLQAQEEQAARTKAKPLSAFPFANVTWGQRFNPEGVIPEDGFYANYFSMKAPNNLIYREKVADISISYIYDEFHNIHSEDFAAYWVGAVTFAQATEKEISVDLSWSSARVVIDGRVVYDGRNNDKTVLVAFEAGKHIIEVEYANNWHTTEFSVAITDNVKTFSSADIAQYFKDYKVVLGDYNLYYAGVYESGNENLSIALNILPNDKPIVLLLSSYSVVKWVINNPHQVDIKAIVYASTAQGVEVRGALQPSTRLLKMNLELGGYELNVECQCVPNGDLLCDYETGVAATVEGLTEHKLNGFTGQYRAEQLNIPELVLDDNLRDTLEIKDEAIKAQRQACSEKSNPDFEALLK